MLPPTVPGPIMNGIATAPARRSARSTRSCPEGTLPDTTNFTNNHEEQRIPPKIWKAATAHQQHTLEERRPREREQGVAKHGAADQR